MALNGHMIGFEEAHHSWKQVDEQQKLKPLNKDYFHHL